MHVSDDQRRSSDWFDSTASTGSTAQPNHASVSGAGHARQSRSRYVELHCASAFSFRRSSSDVEALVTRAAQLRMPALALTDYMTFAGMVRFQEACARYGVRAIAGIELAVADPTFGDTAAPAQLVVLAENAAGYARLCHLLTEANLHGPDTPVIPFKALANQPEGLFLLTGGRGGTLIRLLQARRYEQ